MPFQDRFFNVMWQKIHPENHHKKYDKTPQAKRMKTDVRTARKTRFY